MKRPASLLCVIILAGIALAHVFRVLLNVDAIVAGVVIPMWPSIAAVLFFGFLAAWLFQERRT